MWIERLDIRGFKRLSQDLTLGPHLNVICGPNEAGKSSLHEALLRTLFGFTRSERRRQDGASEKDRCAPWNGASYALNATAHTNEGRLKIEWDFADHKVKVHDLDAGIDLTAQVNARGGDVTLGSFLLGLELEDFRRSCCLDQGTLEAVPSSEGLLGAMRRAVESGGGETGVEDATERLEKVLAEQIGVRRDNLKPTSTGRLRGLIDECEAIEAQLDEAEQGRETLVELECERREAEHDRDRVQADLRAVEQERLRAAAAAASERLEHVRSIAAQAEAEPPEGEDVPKETRAAIGSRRDELKRLTDQRAEAAPRAAAAESSVTELESQRAKLTTQRASLAGYEQVDATRQAEVQGLLARLEGLGDPADQVKVPGPATEPPAPEVPEPDSQVSESGADVPEPEAQVPEPGAEPSQVAALGLWLGAAAAAVLSIGAAALTTPAALAGLLVAAVLAYLAARRRAASTQAEAARREEHERRAREREALAARREALAAKRKDLERQLGAALDATGAATTNDAIARAHHYLKACNHHHEINRIDGELGRLQGKLDSAAEPAKELRQIDTRLEEVRADLAERYAALGIDSADPAAAGREFDRRLEQDDARASKRAEINEARAALHAALGGQTVAGLEEQHAEAEAKLREHVSVHGELYASDDPGQLERRQEDLAGELREHGDRLSTLEGRITASENQLPPAPALREELDRLQREIGQLKDAAQAIDIARQTLDEAARKVHREFHPQLKSALDRNIGRVTAGRYREVELDEGLGIRVTAPETGRLVPAEQLSRGAQDQIYFLERLELIRMLDARAGDAPLLLDEPFAHYDAARLAAALELLVEETRDRQVLLFTCDDDLVQAATAARNDLTVTDLTAQP